ncbi:hypothetical protein ASE66_12485 [Bosea sp. Root483D1]|uniref:Lar family restriction alleviation protein n=1 Tax=Bosea sp. Root483D1 TaxID=1736544 RepID=UPI00070F2238|nr:Lar family restriction alleviation protein [Bosea sp. Root483D1]KRE15656.1 hypothetical protein ASE66_12485 [Bosea sp. Root483D1]
MTGATDSDLLPCPFCGIESARVRHIRDGHKVVCASCQASGPPQYHGRADDEPARIRAASSWNQRIGNAADTLDLPEDYHEPASRHVVERFLTTMRQRLAYLEATALKEASSHAD